MTPPLPAVHQWTAPAKADETGLSIPLSSCLKEAWAGGAVCMCVSSPCYPLSSRDTWILCIRWAIKDTDCDITERSDTLQPPRCRRRSVTDQALLPKDRRNVGWRHAVSV